MDFDQFSRWERDLKVPNEELHRIVLLEMQARLHRMGLALPKLPVATKSKRGAAVHNAGLSKVEKMACFIAQHYLEPVDVNDIGKFVGLHPNYAMGLFKKTFGTTLIDYLTHHRISHAQRLLATTDEKIVEVAFSSGFGSISRFNEAFRLECQCSPRDYRRRHRFVD